ncbi:Ribonuclease 3 [Fusobacterium sp. DD29]|uniref:ribonuclease III n=1 Tax=unclassified Fusobacterium TaxID=2648384 RepID=UPI001B8D830D|nr:MULTISPECIES: ribonuclease III [unclassified Fusobacterium]MBR8701209.1 Ribonuclease 3 [Fusobacterium sp. DD45]MBR8710955.1 Ribonuclease 3 [Fusobacterium sp. DD28]MBR8750187.1 Ribonuclease 3 [Fusobacterium sp. DD29]MBR8751529.1 Ribonuclease 3 [Fusobacterium sp. DD26]MBR8762429.1 Ribonuclease 3 [Fusobacterium sp. DD25]
MKKNYLDFERNLGYSFNNKDLLKNSLLHRSFGNEHRKYKKISNERLELLGDAVLDLVVTEYLYKSYENSTEGDLAKIKSMVVSEPVLAAISKKLEVGKYLLLSRGEELTGGRERSSILGDAFEAILGAIYIDSDFETAKKFALSHIKDSIDNVDTNEEILDFKTILQEYSQKEYKIIPEYLVINEIGPDHQKIFEIAVKINNGVDKELVAVGSGKNKKSAEQAAAKVLCKELGVKIHETL